MLRSLVGSEMCIRDSASTPAQPPTSGKLRPVTYKLAFGHCHVCRVMGPFNVMTFGRVTNSLSQAWWPDNTGMCETCGNAWARAPQVSVTHLEDFYFFMDCTGHEIIISSAPHPKPHQLGTALCSIQARLWTLQFVQGHGPLLCHDIRRSHKLARSSLVA